VESMVRGTGATCIGVGASRPGQLGGAVAVADRLLTRCRVGGRKIEEGQFEGGTPQPVLWPVSSAASASTGDGGRGRGLARVAVTEVGLGFIFVSHARRAELVGLDWFKCLKLVA
jgi:hypothetical protein